MCQILEDRTQTFQQKQKRIFTLNRTIHSHIEPYNTQSHTIKCVETYVTEIDTAFIQQLWRITKQKPREIQIKRRKWNWIGHTLHEEAGTIRKTALDWNPQGHRRRGRRERGEGQ